MSECHFVAPAIADCFPFAFRSSARGPHLRIKESWCTGHWREVAGSLQRGCNGAGDACALTVSAVMLTHIPYRMFPERCASDEPEAPCTVSGACFKATSAG